MTLAKPYRNHPAFAPMTIDLWDGKVWVQREVMGALYASTLLLSDGSIYSSGFWRLPGTRPYACCQVSHRALSRIRGGVGLAQARELAKNRSVAGPFTMKEKYIADKMVKENPQWKMEKRHGQWWVVPRKLRRRTPT